MSAANRLNRAGATVLLLLAASFAAGSGRSAAAPADGGPAPARPNIVVIAVDTLRSDHLGCYGYRRATSPNIDRLASQGLLFENCSSPGSWTIPSMMSMWTGLQPNAHGCTNMSSTLPADVPTFPERLKESGYYCTAIVSNPLMNAKFGFGRGFDHYDDFSVFLDAEMKLLSVDHAREAAGVSELVTSPLVTREAQSLLKKARGTGKPYFLFVHYFDPHDSYVPPPPYDKQFDAGNYSGPVTGRNLPAMRNAPPAGRDLEKLIALYDGEIAHTDVQVGRLIEAIDAGDDASRTVTILVGDHGEAFGEHGALLHGENVFRETIAVPLVCRWPGVTGAARREAAPVTLADVPVTLRELTGLDGLSQTDGRSFAPALRGNALPADRVIISDQANRQSFAGEFIGFVRLVAISGNLRLHCSFVGSPDGDGSKFELFDLSNDPREQKNVIDARRDDAEKLKAVLWKQWSGGLERYKAFAGGRPPQRLKLDERERQRLNGLGYVSDGAPKPK
jgi:arylsulfatase A-like enzyme